MINLFYLKKNQKNVLLLYTADEIRDDKAKSIIVLLEVIESKSEMRAVVYLEDDIR